MLGWEIYVFRQPPEGLEDRAVRRESLLASWMAGLGELDWLDELVREGKAVDIGGNGYPCRYTATATILLSKLSDGPPRHSGPPVVGDDYVLLGGWIGEVKIDRERLAQCPPDEELMIEAWDQS